jgi:transcriptional regulator with XRE-family HTH domain
MTSPRSRRSTLQSPPGRKDPQAHSGEELVLVASVRPDAIAGLSDELGRAKARTRRTCYVHDRDTLKRVLALRLRAALDEKGWTLGKAAKAVSRYLPEGSKLKRAHLSDYTRARHLPGPRYLFALAKALGMEPWELLEGDASADKIGEWRKPAVQTATTGAGAETVQVLDLGSEAWLDIRRCVPWPTALEVLRMLQDGGRKA